MILVLELCKGVNNRSLFTCSTCRMTSQTSSLSSFGTSLHLFRNFWERTFLYLCSPLPPLSPRFLVVLFWEKGWEGEMTPVGSYTIPISFCLLFTNIIIPRRLQVWIHNYSMFKIFLCNYKGKNKKPLHSLQVQLKPASEQIVWPSPHSSWRPSYTTLFV